jgi:hypothetical protein
MRYEIEQGTFYVFILDTLTGERVQENSKTISFARDAYGKALRKVDLLNA